MKIAAPDDIKSKLDKFSKLQSMPQVILKIKQISEDPKASAADLANCILSDHQLTSRVLQVANSAHYGSFAGKITTVTRALILIGSRAIRNIALSMGIFQIVNNMSRESKFNLKTFWTRSLGCGIIAKFLAHRMNMPKMVEEVFIAGFMHDIGQAILAAIYPDKYYEISKLDNEQDILDIHKTENVIFGIDHMRAGGYMAEKWNLPKTLIKAISDHHTLDTKNGKTRKAHNFVPKLVYISDRLVGYVVGNLSIESQAFEAIKEQTIELLGITEEDITELPEICRKQINEIAQELEIDIDDGLDKQDVLEKDITFMQEQLNSKDIQLAFLQNATDALIDAKTDDEILQITCEAIFRGLQMGRVILFEYDPKWESFIGKVGFGPEPQHKIQALTFSAKQGLFNHIRKTSDSVSVVVDNKEIYGKLVTVDEITRLSLKAFAAIPIRILDEVKYVIIVDAHDNKIPISNEAVRSMMSLANQGSMSLERNLLKAQLKKLE